MRTTVQSRKADCTGCGACVGICPKDAITMRADPEGFLYPAVDGAKCVECGLCEKTCPAGKTPPVSEGPVLGAQCRDRALRRRSSSGGLFSLLARRTLAQGGVVFGAALDEALCLEHIGVFDADGVERLLGSKYLQSDAADAIANARELLTRGIPVLFSGTPCQIAGLLETLREKERALLLTVDFVCHGVPSPAVFSSFLRSLEEGKRRAVSCGFRDKRNGWKDFSLTVTFDDGSEHTGSQVSDPYLYGFLQNLYLRPSCHACTAYRNRSHPADITLADLWGAETVCPKKDDDTGLSLVMLNTKKGEAAFSELAGQIESFPCAMEPLLRANPSIAVPVPPHPKRARFMKAFAREGFRAETVFRLTAPPGRLERAAARIAHLPAGLKRRIGVLLHRGKP